MPLVDYAGVKDFFELIGLLLFVVLSIVFISIKNEKK